jgi:hypothetical protein
MTIPHPEKHGFAISVESVELEHRGESRDSVGVSVPGGRAHIQPFSNRPRLRIGSRIRGDGGEQRLEIEIGNNSAFTFNPPTQFKAMLTGRGVPVAGLDIFNAHEQPFGNLDRLTPMGEGINAITLTGQLRPMLAHRLKIYQRSIAANARGERRVCVTLTASSVEPRFGKRYHYLVTVSPEFARQRLRWHRHPFILLGTKWRAWQAFRNSLDYYPTA